jgi:hypothetical protein
LRELFLERIGGIRGAILRVAAAKRHRRIELAQRGEQVRARDRAAEGFDFDLRVFFQCEPNGFVERERRCGGGAGGAGGKRGGEREEDEDDGRATRAAERERALD